LDCRSFDFAQDKFWILDYRNADKYYRHVLS
jgi:hypothetical protein